MITVRPEENAATAGRLAARRGEEKVHGTSNPGPAFTQPLSETTLADAEERTLGDLTVRIDRLICVGFGDCIEEGVGAFRFDDEGIATFTPDAGGVDPALLLEACRSCPVDAITVTDPDGDQIVP